MTAPVLVTGSAAGIGAAVAARLRAAGTEVIGLDLRDADVVCDLSDPAAIDAVTKRLPARLGGIASVAGVPGTHPPARVLAVNLEAPRLLASALADRLPAGAAVVTVSSVAAGRCTRSLEEVEAAVADGAHPDFGADGSAAYDFSKRALNALTLAFARLWVDRGVRCLSVSPGPTQTAILGDFEQTMGADRMAAAQQVVGRHATADDVAGPVVFALGQDARWVNAIDLRVDGGLVGIR